MVGAPDDVQENLGVGDFGRFQYRVGRAINLVTLAPKLPTRTPVHFPFFLVHIMASPAIPGLFFCLVATILLIIVRVASYSQVPLLTYIHRSVSLHQPGIACISFVHPMGV
jgi:hypothetical protein